jgi:hypothetical protein
VVYHYPYVNTRLGKKFCNTSEKVYFYAQTYSETITTTLQNIVHRFQRSFATDLQASGFD